MVWLVYTNARICPVNYLELGVGLRLRQYVLLFKHLPYIPGLTVISDSCIAIIIEKLVEGNVLLL